MAAVGGRLRVKGSCGTIRYYGNIAGTTGEWIGVEWDDPERGKHDGSKDGVRYFQCREATAGSFIRPSATVEHGQPFLEALRSKYCEELQGENESVTLGSSKGAIEVEVVNLDMIRANLGRLETIREVSLQDVSSVNDPNVIRQTCPEIQGLDLSECLLPAWTSVEQLCSGLPRLERLHLNRTRLELPLMTAPVSHAFASIQELQLNDTRLVWQDYLRIEQLFPKLAHAEMGFNGLRSLQRPEPGTVNKSLQTLNMDSNLIDQWVDICTVVETHEALSRLFLANNALVEIPPPGLDFRPLEGLKHLSITSNKIGHWSDIDMLAIWCPNLETLRILNNPISTSPEMEHQYRQIVIAKMPTLTDLDSTPITASERRDCELFYISFVSRLEYASTEDRDKAHPRWRALCEQWGAPEEASSRTLLQNKLSGQLINVLVYSLREVEANADAVPLRILQSMPLKLLRAKVLKTLKTSGTMSKATKSIKLHLKMADDRMLELESEKDAQEVDWLGVDEGSHLYYSCT